MDSFEKQENSDKPLGSDWGTGKLTLPFILLRQVASVVEKEELDGFILGKDPSISSEHSRLRISQLFEKYNILTSCVEYLEQSCAHTNGLLNEFTNVSLRNDLNSFLHRFSNKFARISELKTSNFLAV